MFNDLPISSEGYELFQLLFMIISEVYCGLICFIFLLISLRDVTKKKYLLNQCRFMICTRRNRRSEKKIFPVIDITEP